jgi:uncharacterized protein
MLRERRRIVRVGAMPPQSGNTRIQDGQEDEMSNMQGNFVWYELMTTDPTAAEKFYRGVVGWKSKDSGMPDMSYTLLMAGDDQVAGLMEIPEEPRKAGAGPFWMGYIWADDVDATAKEIKKAGGAIHREPTDIPGVGRFAVAADPHGASFCLFKAGDQPQSGGSGNGASNTAPGHAGWRELMAGNLDEALKFYSGLFGWEKGEAMDMGAMGVYQIFAKDGVMLGGMMTKPDMVPRPYWTYYFNVPEIKAAADQVTKSGGKVMNGPMEVPGGAWILQGTDPQGAYFALVAPPAAA